MASSSSSSSTQNRTYSYDVFLSFRGKNTRDQFTDHLYKALIDAGFRTFRDDDSIERGEEVMRKIETAIRESRSSVVVLSEDYANSKSCLKELVWILEQRRSSDHFVLPVFYHVDTSDIGNHKNSFAIEVKEGDEGWTESNVNQWKAALKEVAGVAGKVASGPETNFIALIVDEVEYKLQYLKQVSTPSHLVGMESRAKAIYSWLESEEYGANVLAICGMGGSGKTTLAAVIYNSNTRKFRTKCFLKEIQKHKIPDLQIDLLSAISRGENTSMCGVPELTSKVERVLQEKEVLLVLDDINESDDLDALVGTKELHPQTKIIITTRDQNIYKWFGSISRECKVYKIELLNEDESLELLCFHAFRSKIPMECFKEVAIQMAQYCGGNPLGLKVLGSFLPVKADEDPSTISKILEAWRTTLNSLNLKKGNLNYKIGVILRKSYDSLPLDIYRDLFLHIAFFFVGNNEDDVVKILADDWNANDGMITLISRCLLTVSPGKNIIMHQLLQEMARNIVLKESAFPAKRSRVSQNNESYDLLRNGEGSETIEGLALDMRPYISKRSELMCDSDNPSALNTASLAKMHRLKLLKLQYVRLSGSYANFPKLRWLYWSGCHLKTIPSGLLGRNLVAIKMSEGKLRTFEPPMGLNSLKILNLKDSHELVSICNLDRLPKLEQLVLWNCSRLTHVCKTIGGLKNLSLLDFTGCLNLFFRKEGFLNLLKVSLNSGGGNPQQSLFSIPESVKYLYLNNCVLHKRDVPVIFSGRPQFFYVDLGFNQFEALPNNINLKGLTVLDLICCTNLKSLLCLPSTLEKLYVDLCYDLEEITFESGLFRLREFEYQVCCNLSEVQGLFKLVSLAKLDEADLKPMSWFKFFEDREVYLVGDEILERRTMDTEVLYEYGIMSIYLQPDDNGLKVPAGVYTSSSSFLSFRVPSCPEKRRIRGLYIVSMYMQSVEGEDDKWVLFTKVSNKTKGLTWMYNPVVYCLNGAWLSYWPIGNILDAGDEVNVSIIVGSELTVLNFGASLVYMDEGDELELESSSQNHTKEKEVIGGDLSEFQLSSGAYYLCRRDFFKSSTTPDWLRMLVGDTIDPHKELHGWRKSRRSTPAVYGSPKEMEFFRRHRVMEMQDADKYVPNWRDQEAQLLAMNQQTQTRF